jgi:hypothetical protein
MSGVKGRSGRKPDNSGWTARAVALYIPSWKGGKNWNTIWWFRLFKKIYGTRATAANPYNWQEKVRMLIKAEVMRYTDQNGWFCECEGHRLNRWHFRHDPQCNKCGYEPRDLERHRTVASARAHTIAPRTPKETLKMCPSCEKPLSSKPSKFGTLWFCEVC